MIHARAVAAKNTKDAVGCMEATLPLPNMLGEGCDRMIIELEEIKYELDEESRNLNELGESL